MEKKTVKETMKDAGKAASGLLNKAHDSVAHAVDVNGDGKFDLGDIKQAAEGVGGAAKKAAEGMGDAAKKAAINIKDSVEQSKKRRAEKKKNTKYAADLEALSPIFEDEINRPDFALPKFIMLIDGPDKAHKASEACIDSVGFTNKTDKMDIMTIYKDDADILDVKFYPDEDSEAYYMNPVDRSTYISLKKYTEYMIIQRMNELQRIAQSLGAKHFKVRIVKSDSVIEENAVGLQGKVEAVKAEVKYKRTKKKRSIFDMTAENTFLGQDPERPVLNYLSKDIIVQNLIEMRLHGNVMQSQKLYIKLSDTSGVKTEDALKIGAALDSIKCSAGVSFVKETEIQSNSDFEYIIEF